jgi:hypothetical protein
MPAAVLRTWNCPDDHTSQPEISKKKGERREFDVPLRGQNALEGMTEKKI